MYKESSEIDEDGNFQQAYKRVQYINQYAEYQKEQGEAIKVKAIHYVPSNEQFMKMISSGYAYGMVPDWQSKDLRSKGEVVEVHERAHDSVKHYWHCWNIDSMPLKTLSKRLVNKAKILLS